MEPAGQLDPQPWMQAAETAQVTAALEAGNAPVRFVGGCVRDALLDRPVKDVDIATALPPERVIELLEAAGIKAVPTGFEHGTVTAVTGGKGFEVTTLRHDVETFGRHARVAFTDDWAADAQRRDFTFNAIFCDPNGTLYDPTGGLGDLKAGRVRFVGDAAQRIEEDVLRILRFFRFHAHYGKGDIDGDGLAACAAQAGKLPTLSAERVSAELMKLLAAPAPAPTLGLMAETGVLAEILPEAGPPDRLERLCAIEEKRGLTDPVRRLAALLDLDPAGAAALARRLRLPNAAAQRLGAIAGGDVTLTADMTDRALRQALYRAGAEYIVDRILLDWSSEEGGNRAGQLDIAQAWQPPQLPVKGRDVLDLGIDAGPAVGDLVAAVENWWVEGDFRADRAACLGKLRQLSAE